MPLNNDSSVANAYRITSIGPSQTQRSQHEPNSRSSTPLHRSREPGIRHDKLTDASNKNSNPLGARDVSSSRAQDRSRAVGLKMDVPITIRNQAGNAAPEVRAQGDGLATRSKSPERGRSNKQPKSQVNAQTRFDDTTLDFDDGSSLQDNDNQTIVFRGEGLQPFQQQEQYYKQNMLKQHPIFASTAFRLPDDWQNNVREEKAFQAQGQGVQFDNDEVPEYYPHNSQYSDEAVPEQHEYTVDTPSRGHSAQPTRDARVTQSKTVSFEPHDANGRQTESGYSLPAMVSQTDTVEGLEPDTNHKLNTNILGAAVYPEMVGSPTRTKEAPSTKSISTRKVTNATDGKLSHAGKFEPLHLSDDSTSPVDEDSPVRSRPPTPPPAAEDKQNGLKRRRGLELDHDLSSLRHMKYEDLQKESFSTSPKGSGQDVAFDSHGNAMTLSQRLNNLDKMSEEDQKNMFRNQTDQEWSQMGSWFINKFQEDLKRLMDVRTERRKISMKYEGEIRRRQKDVEWCSANVEEELKGLKKGGGELIKGREASSRKGTPQKK